MRMKRSIFTNNLFTHIWGCFKYKKEGRYFLNFYCMLKTLFIFTLRSLLKFAHLSVQSLAKKRIPLARIWWHSSESQNWRESLKIWRGVMSIYCPALLVDWRFLLQTCTYKWCILYHFCIAVLNFFRGLPKKCILVFTYLNQYLFHLCWRQAITCIWYLFLFSEAVKAETW